MQEYKLKFNDQAEAITALSSRFFTTDDEGNETPWDGVQSPFVNAQGEHLVVVHEPVSVDENGEPNPPTWTGFHVDALLSDSTGLESYSVVVDTPAHKFA